MLSTSNTQRRPPVAGPFRVIMLILAVGAMFGALFLALVFFGSPAGIVEARGLGDLFAFDTTQAWWYVTRSAGIMAFLLTWWSTVWGLGLAARLFHPAVEPNQQYDFHEFVSLLALVFMFVHAGVLLLDRFLPFSVAQILVPFISPYRPLWVGLGIIGLYTFVLVTATFYGRRLIGTRAFRSIHVLSLLGYLGAALHGLLAGTDSGLTVTRLMYALTFLAVIFLTVYWFVINASAKTEVVAAPARMGAAFGHQRREDASLQD